jgi:hypothetical protein
MKKFKVAVLFGFLLACMNLNGCSVETVPAGNVGIKVNLYRDSKGVQQEAINKWNVVMSQFMSADAPLSFVQTK